MISRRDSIEREACDEPHLIALPQGLMLAPLSFEVLSVTVAEDPFEQWRQKAYPHEQQHVYITSVVRVLDRDNAEPRDVRFSKQISKQHVDMVPDYLAVMVREVLYEMFRHELDELLLRDGVRIREPHRDGA